MVRGDETVPQLATRYGLHPTQVNAWKRQLTSQASELFARGKGSSSTPDAQVEELYRVIGQLTVEKDFFSRQARSLSVSQHRAMIGPDTDLRVSQQCRLLGLSRSTYYYQPAPVTADGLVLLRQMDEQYLKTPHLRRPQLCDLVSASGRGRRSQESGQADGGAGDWQYGAATEDECAGSFSSGVSLPAEGHDD